MNTSARLGLALLALVAVVALVSLGRPSTRAAMHEPNYLSGEIVSLTPDRQQFTLRASNPHFRRDTVVRVDAARTEILLGPAVIAPDALRVGDQATVGFSPGDGGSSPRLARIVRVARAVLATD